MSSDDIDEDDDNVLAFQINDTKIDVNDILVFRRSTILILILVSQKTMQRT